MTDLIGITIHAWQRVLGAWSIGVAGSDIGNLGNPFDHCQDCQSG
jgi:hypothetical protein